MASIIYSPKDIFEQEFKVSMRGYDKREIDEFLDDVIKDYESYEDLVAQLQEENAKLKAQLSARAQARPQTPTPPTSTGVSGAGYASTSRYGGSETSRPSTPQSQSSTLSTNYDILKRISRLEKEVFGKQISE